MSFFEDASLVLIPSGYKASKVYSVKPTDGTGDLTFTRSLDTATRVGADGLIERVRTNLVLQSQTFDNAGWSKSQASVTANSTTAPDGTLTADTLVEDTSNDIHRILQDSLPFTSGVEITLSAFVKPAGRTKIQLRLFDFTSNFGMVDFDISAGSVFLTTAGVGTITDAGNGWYRCSVTAPASATTANGLALIYLLNAGGSDTYTGDGTSGAFLWGAQVERGVRTTYIPTTTAAVSVGMLANVPRLDYEGGGCPRLLLEPQRTNVVANSENTSGYSTFGAAFTQNTATSPQGFVNADTMAGNGASTQIFASTPITFASAGQVTISVFVKANNASFIDINIDQFVGASNTIGIFNLAAGTTASSGAKIENYGNGWYRCSLTATIVSGDLAGFLAIDVRPSAASLTWPSAGDANGKSVFVWGFMAELGSYPTSYIPTLGAAVTRSADAASKTGISALIGQTEGVVFIEVGDVKNNAVTGAELWYLEIRKDQNNSFGLSSAGGAPQPFRFVTKISGTPVTEGEIAPFANSKIAIKYTATQFKLFKNGSLVITSNKNIGGYADIEFMEGASVNLLMILKQFLIFPTALTDAQCIELTA